MADTITTDRDFVTNGQRIPAGKLSTDDIRDLVKKPDKNGNMVNISEDEAKAVQDDLMRRQQHYGKYTRGITEKHTIMSDSGKISMGGGSED